MAPGGKVVGEDLGVVSQPHITRKVLSRQKSLINSVGSSSHMSLTNRKCRSKSASTSSPPQLCVMGSPAPRSAERLPRPASTCRRQQIAGELATVSATSTQAKKLPQSPVSSASSSTDSVAQCEHWRRLQDTFLLSRPKWPTLAHVQNLSSQSRRHSAPRLQTLSCYPRKTTPTVTRDQNGLERLSQTCVKQASQCNTALDYEREPKLTSEYLETDGGNTNVHTGSVKSTGLTHVPKNHTFDIPHSPIFVDYEEKTETFPTQKASDDLESKISRSSYLESSSAEDPRSYVEGDHSEPYEDERNLAKIMEARTNISDALSPIHCDSELSSVKENGKLLGSSIPLLMGVQEKVIELVEAQRSSNEQTWLGMQRLSAALNHLCGPTEYFAPPPPPQPPSTFEPPPVLLLEAASCARRLAEILGLLGATTPNTSVKAPSIPIVPPKLAPTATELQQQKLRLRHVSHSFRHVATNESGTRDGIMHSLDVIMARRRMSIAPEESQIELEKKSTSWES